MKTIEKIDKKLIKFTTGLAEIVGKPYVLLSLFILIAVWFFMSVFLEYSTWYDIMDVFIFLTTFFLLFIIQGSQNADTKAIQEKLDALIEATPKANDKLEGDEKRMKRGDKVS